MLFSFSFRRFLFFCHLFRCCRSVSFSKVVRSIYGSVVGNEDSRSQRARDTERLNDRKHDAVQQICDILDAALASIGNLFLSLLPLIVIVVDDFVSVCVCLSLYR